MQETLKQRCAAANNLESVRTVVDSLAESISAPSSSYLVWSVEKEGRVQSTCLGNGVPAIPTSGKQLAAPDLTATWREWMRIASYFPLVAIGLEVLWVVVFRMARR